VPRSRIGQETQWIGVVPRFFFLLQQTELDTRSRTEWCMNTTADESALTKTEKLFDTFKDQLSQWQRLHKKGELLLQQFSSDVASLRENNATLASELHQLGLSIDIIASESKTSIVAEQRLQELRSVASSLGEVVSTMSELSLDVKQKLSTEPSSNLLERSFGGCGLSCADYVEIMDEYLDMHQNELDVKRSIVESLSFSTSSMVLTTYLVTWQVQPFFEKNRTSTIKRKLKLNECLKRSAQG